MVLLLSATILLMVPFKYVLALLLLDIFTGELQWRKEMRTKFFDLLRERWSTVPAPPVVVLPYQSKATGSKSPSSNDQRKLVKRKDRGNSK